MQAQQTLLNGLIESAMDAIVATDEQQNILIFNHAAEQMFGYRAADIIGQALDLLLPIRFREKHRQHIIAFGKTGHTSRTMNMPGISYALRADGEEFPFEATISQVNIAGKNIYTAIMRDITKRKQNEEALRLAASVYQASHEGIVVTDENNLIVDINPAFTAITGYTLEEVRGKNPRIFQSGKHGQPFYQQMWQSIQNHGYWQGELWDRRKDGKFHAKWLSISAIRHKDGSLFRYVGQFSDITEKKLKDEQKLALSYKKLQQLALHLDKVREEERTRIAREIHDECGATLTALKMRIHWLESQLPPEMAQLTAEAEQMNKLVDEMIHTMRHVVSQLMPIQLHDIGFAAAVERYVQDFMKHTGVESGLVLPESELTLEENQSCVLFRVLQESLNNVAKHAQATSVSILFIIRDGSLILVVKDNGVGFDRNTNKDNAFGLLGIMERALMIKGKARISSKPGKGTQVVVKIPLAGR
jgi:PAS domain S-box-containing protein